MKEARNNPQLSDKEIEAITDKYIECQVAEASLQKEYHVKFKKVLSMGKLLKLYEAEHQFKKQLLKEMRGGHEKVGGEGSDNKN